VLTPRIFRVLKANENFNNFVQRGDVLRLHSTHLNADVSQRVPRNPRDTGTRITLIHISGMTSIHGALETGLMD